MPPRKKTALKKSEPTLFEQLGTADNAPAPAAAPTCAAPTCDGGAAPTEHILLKLPISDARIDELLHTEEMQMVLEYNPNISEPIPYDAENIYECIDGTVAPPIVPAATTLEPTASNVAVAPSGPACFWCCHPIEHRSYGMPIRYDTYSKAFTLYGSFCSLQCASAHNFSVNPGSDRAWEIQSWIQMLGHRYGFADTIRPAPSRYLLNMFGGPMTIEEFRASHKNTSKTYTLNIPPIISVTAQSECINTSYIGKST